jgi:hypothetical protein
VVTAEHASTFGTAAIADQLGSGIELSMYWGVPLDSGGRPPASSATGDTNLDATFTLGELRYYEGPDCDPIVQAPVTIAFSTRGGRVAGEAAGFIVSAGGAAAWTISAVADLAAVTGTPELPLDHASIQDGQLELFVTGHPTVGARGMMRALVRYYDSEADYERRLTAELGDHAWSKIVEPFRGWFPKDECGDQSFPVASDEASAWLVGGTPAELFEEAKSMLADLAPITAQWRDGVETTIELELGSVSDLACIDAETATLHGTARIKSADGRVDLELPEVEIMRAPDSSAPARVRVLAQQDGFLVEAQHAFDGSDTTGRIVLFDDNAIACMVWPPSTVPLASDCTP